MGNLAMENKLELINKKLDAMLLGAPSGAFSIAANDALFREVEDKLDRLSQNINEIYALTLSLAKGDTDAPIPERHNYMAGAIKQLHSQYCRMEWSLNQLREGNVVSRMEPGGGLHNAFNALVDHIAQASLHSPEETYAPAESNYNSWRYYQLLMALNLLHIMVLEVDAHGDIVYANLQAKQYFGEAKSIFPQGGGTNKLKDYLCRVSREDVSFPVFFELHDDDNGAWYKIVSDRFLLPNSQELYLHMVDNISEWKAQESQLIYCATIDAMTGMLNRQSGIDELNLLLQHSDPDAEHCLVFIDVDNLKRINDYYGHDEGDYAIKAIAQAIIFSMRGSDAVSRHGGDEFMALFKNCSEQDVNKIMRRVNKQLDEQNRTVSKPYKVSFSWGLVQFCTVPPKDAFALIAKADQNMYAHKLSKRARNETRQDSTFV